MEAHQQPMVCATACHIPQAAFLCKFESSVAQPAFASPLVELCSSPLTRPLAVCSTTVSETCSDRASPSRHSPAEWNSVCVGHRKPLEADRSWGLLEHDVDSKRTVASSATRILLDDAGPEKRRRAWSAAEPEPSQDSQDQRVETASFLGTHGALRCSQSDWEAIRIAFGLVPQEEDAMQSDTNASASRRSSERRVQFCPGEPLDFEEDGEELDLPGPKLPRTPHPLTPRAAWPMELQPPGKPPAVAPSTARRLWRVQCCPDVVRDPCGRSVAWPAEAQVAWCSA